MRGKRAENKLEGVKNDFNEDATQPGNPFQDNRVNLTACFYNVLRLTELS